VVVDALARRVILEEVLAAGLRGGRQRAARGVASKAASSGAAPRRKAS